MWCRPIPSLLTLPHHCALAAAIPAGSTLRALPLWEKLDLETSTAGKRNRLSEWLQSFEALRDPTLLHLLTRLLEPDPTHRISAREAQAHPWFTAAPRIDKDAPNHGEWWSQFVAVASGSAQPRRDWRRRWAPGAARASAITTPALSLRVRVLLVFRHCFTTGRHPARKQRPWFPCWR